MQLLSQLLIRVCLDAERLLDRQHLEQERELRAISLSNRGREEGRVLSDEVEERATGGYVP